MNAQEFKGNDKLLLGIVFGVLTFWLFAQSLINVVVAIRESVDIPMESLNMAISLTALFSGCFIVVAGGLADKFGRMRFTYIGFILSIIGSLCLIFATGTILFTLGRVIQGLSAACIMPATLALIKTYYDGAARQRALSFWSIGSWGGSGVCSLAGGAIATYLGWHWIFIISIIFAIAGMFLIRGTPESKVEDHEQAGSFDYLGLFAFLITLLSLNVLITKGAKLGWTSNISVGLLGVVVVMGIVFIAIERRKKDRAFIDFALFEKASYSGATISNFLLNAVAGTLIVANTYIQMGRGFSSFQSGMMSIGYLIAVLLMIRVGEKILQKIGAKKPMLLGTGITGVGIFLMTFTFLDDFSYIIVVLIGFVLFGLGLGIYATPSTDTAISDAPNDKVGIASGIYKMASSLGGAFGVAISATIYSSLNSTGVDNAAFVALMINVVFCILAILSIIFLVPKNAGIRVGK